MTNAQEIIQEALEWRYNENKRDNQSILERLFDFSTWGSSYESKGKSSAIVYLTDRLIEAEHEKVQAEKKAYEQFKAARQVVEMYGPEAMERLRTISPHLE